MQVPKEVRLSIKRLNHHALVGIDTATLLSLRDRIVECLPTDEATGKIDAYI